MPERSHKSKVHCLLALMVVACAAGCSPATTADPTSNSPQRTAVQLTSTAITWTGTELLGRPTANSITVKAIADQGVDVYFEYGTTSGTYGSPTSTTTFSDGMVEVILSGLLANTLYYYRMQYRLAGSSDAFLVRGEHTFQTQRASTETFTFDIQSDSHQGYTSFYDAALYEVTHQNIANDKPDFLIDLGDAFSTDDSKKNASGKTVTAETQATVRQKYLNQRTFFQIEGHSTPVFLVLGNHENEEGWNLDDFGTDLTSMASSLPVIGANARKRYFLNPVPDSFYTGNSDQLAALDGDHLRGDYYAFQWGSALFVMIDPFWYTMKKPFAGSMGGELDDETVGNRWDWTLGKTQYDWLTNTLNNSTATQKFVFAHQSAGGGLDDYIRGGALGAKYCEWGGIDPTSGTNLFASKRVGWGKPIHTLFVDTHVTAFFHGHDHVFAKEILDGVVYQECPFAANTNPANSMGFSTNATDYAGADEVANSGYLRVTVSPNSTKVEYVHSFASASAGTNGSVAYSYNITASTTNTVTSTQTATDTQTVTATHTTTATQSQTSTKTQTQTATQTSTGTKTTTATQTATKTQIVTATTTSTSTATQTATGTATGTANKTLTSTATATQIQTLVGSKTQTYVLTGTLTATDTATVYAASWPKTQGSTATATTWQIFRGLAVTTVTATLTSTFNNTETKTVSAILAGRVAATGSVTVMATATRTTGSTNIGTGSRTLTATATATKTATQSWTYHPTATITQTLTNTSTQTGTSNSTVTKIATVTDTQTVTNTSTQTATNTSTSTSTITNTSTVTQTTTSTVTNTITTTITSTGA
jgi:hypothetical protein